MAFSENLNFKAYTSPCLAFYFLFNEGVNLVILGFQAYKCFLDWHFSVF